MDVPHGGHDPPTGSRRRLPTTVDIRRRIGRQGAALPGHRTVRAGRGPRGRAGLAARPVHRSRSAGPGNEEVSRRHGRGVHGAVGHPRGAGRGTATGMDPSAGRPTRGPGRPGRLAAPARRHCRLSRTARRHHTRPARGAARQGRHSAAVGIRAGPRRAFLAPARRGAPRATTFPVATHVMPPWPGRCSTPPPTCFGAPPNRRVVDHFRPGHSANQMVTKGLRCLPRCSAAGATYPRDGAVLQASFGDPGRLGMARSGCIFVSPR